MVVGVVVGVAEHALVQQCVVFGEFDARVRHFALFAQPFVAFAAVPLARVVVVAVGADERRAGAFARVRRPACVH